MLLAAVIISVKHSYTAVAFDSYELQPANNSLLLVVMFNPSSSLLSLFFLLQFARVSHFYNSEEESRSETRIKYKLSGDTNSRPLLFQGSLLLHVSCFNILATRAWMVPEKYK